MAELFHFLNIYCMVTRRMKIAALTLDCRASFSMFIKLGDIEVPSD